MKRKRRRKKTIQHPPGFKVCRNPECGIEKPYEEFKRAGGGKYRAQCKECEAKAELKKSKLVNNVGGLYTPTEVRRLVVKYPITKIDIRGVYVGVIIRIKHREHRCFSILKGETTVTSENAGRAWLVRQVGISWEILKKSVFKIKQYRGD